MSLIRAVSTIGSLTLLSRVTGFARDVLLARVLGAGILADVFFVAFRFPNLFRRLFAEGAFNAAFVPLFSGKLETEGASAARLFARRALSVLAGGLLLFVVGMELAMPWALRVLAPGFEDVPGKAPLAVSLSRITFPYLLFISLTALGAGMLNALEKFAVPAAAPILLNLTLIVALVGFGHTAATPAHALAWGVFAAGLIQLVWVMFPLFRRRMAPTPAVPRFTPAIRALLARMVPGVVGAGVYQINLLVDTLVATLVANGAVSWLYYADRVTQLPLGVVGVAVSTALLPLLSRRIKSGDEAGAVAAMNRGVEVALFLTLPAAVALFLLAEPVLAVLFERGEFSTAETQASAAALRVFVFGLPAYVLIRIQASVFFAHEDTASPVRVAVVAMVVNLTLNLLLMGPLGHVGIATATAVASWTNALLLYVFLRRRRLFEVDVPFRKRFPRILVALVAMGGALFAARAGLSALDPRWYGGPVAFLRYAGMVALVVGGAAVYFAVALWTGAATPDRLKAMIKRGKT